MNRVDLIGRLTKDPELSYTPNGIPKTNFTIAVNRKQKKEQGQPDQADFIYCIAWRKVAENLANYQRKGSQIAVEGHIEVSSYDGSDGKRQYKTVIVADAIHFLEPRTQQQAATPTQNHYQQTPPSQSSYQQAPPQQGQYQQPYGQPPYQAPPQQQREEYPYNRPPY